MYANLLVLALLFTQSYCDLFSKIDPKVQLSILNGEGVNIIVSFNGGTTKVLEEFNQISSLLDRTQRLTSLRDRLLSNAQQSQEKVWNLLTLLNLKFKSFWISNQIFIKNALAATILLIAEHVDVGFIDKERDIPLDEPMDQQVFIGLIPNGAWGVNQINAPQAQDTLGTQGEGCDVGTIDSGVLGSHEALVNNYRGLYGWYDPVDESSAPIDSNGHGTHTMGTICGAGGIGVAPGAKWSCCRGCGTSSCAQADLTACGQFMMCPTLPDGSSPDCSQAPQIVSNSWGGGQGQTWFDGIINAFHSAGIIPVCSIGNSGPDCRTASSMGDNPNVIGVGATDSDDCITSFSSCGPSTYGRGNTIKPDISAPGSNIMSSYNNANNGYATLSGTSMACPHVTGTIALMLAKNSNLSYNQIVDLLRNNSEQDLCSDQTTCGGTQDDFFPNNIYGCGRVDAWQCAQAISQTKATNNTS